MAESNVASKFYYMIIEKPFSITDFMLLKGLKGLRTVRDLILALSIAPVIGRVKVPLEI